MTTIAAYLILFAFVLLSLLMWKWGNRFQTPHLKFSSLSPFLESPGNFREVYANIPKQLVFFSLIACGIAFLDPHYFVKKDPQLKTDDSIQPVHIPSEGVAIYLVLDQSGSMAGELKTRRGTMTKMDLLKKVSKEFVAGDKQIGLSGRSQDMLGLLTFARGAQVLAPLTLDHQSIIDRLNTLSYISDLNLDGTAIGYAIYKTANLIAATRHYAQELEGEGKPAYTIKSSIMIVVTDGLQAPSPLDKDKELRNVELLDAAKFAKKQGIKVYIINVEPRIASQEFSAHRSLMKKVAELTGGKFYLVEERIDLATIYSEIDKLEKSALPVETHYMTPPKSMLPQLYRRVSFYPYLIAAAMFAVFAAVFLETVVFRRVP